MFEPKSFIGTRQQMRQLSQLNASAMDFQPGQGHETGSGLNYNAADFMPGCKQNFNSDAQIMPILT